MPDDIIRKATTADYIDTIDNLRAEVKRLRSQSVEQVFRKKNEELAAKDAYIKRLEAAFLGATKEIVYAIHEGRDAPEGEDVYAEKVAREALERIKNGND